MIQKVEKTAKAPTGELEIFPIVGFEEGQDQNFDTVSRTMECGFVSEVSDGVEKKYVPTLEELREDAMNHQKMKQQRQDAERITNRSAVLDKLRASLDELKAEKQYWLDHTVDKDYKKTEQDHLNVKFHGEYTSFARRSPEPDDFEDEDEDNYEKMETIDNIYEKY